MAIPARLELSSARCHRSWLDPHSSWLVELKHYVHICVPCWMDVSLYNWFAWIYAARRFVGWNGYFGLRIQIKINWATGVEVLLTFQWHPQTLISVASQINLLFQIQSVSFQSVVVSNVPDNQGHVELVLSNSWMYDRSWCDTKPSPGIHSPRTEWHKKLCMSGRVVRACHVVAGGSEFQTTALVIYGIVVTITIPVNDIQYRSSALF